jgi:hypothetical protein
MKLELKHLAPYLPYQVLVGDGRTPFELTEYNFTNVYPYITSLYLRPLSDLTKEIEVNGEKFVPLSILEEKFRPLSRDLNIFLFNGRISIDIETQDYSQTIDLFDGFLIIQKLLEWHFDVFGLIENNLAIDINTLKD